jgi:hypothetical protein
LLTKFVSEYNQLDDGEINFILIDVTSLIGRLDEYVEFIQQLFNDYQNDHITAAILVSKRFLVENNEIQTKFAFVATYNEFAENSKEKVDIMMKMITSNFEKT